MAVPSDFDDSERGRVMDESERFKLAEERRHGRRFVRFIPDLSAGTIFQTITLILLAGGAYGTYTADRTQTRAELDQVKATALANQTTVSQALNEQKLDIKSTRDSVQSIEISLGKIQTRLEMQQQQQPRVPTK